jgi:hypothetical protein
MGGGGGISSIPTIGGGGASVKPQNDYLSMIGDNKNRQPRMRMGGNAPAAEEKPKPKPKPIGIMDGLDELENL